MKKLSENIFLWVAVLVAALPAMIFRDFTPDNELRYLSIADEALRDGHIFAFYNQGVPYADKPPLYLWIVMLCKLILGKHSMLLLSMFSVIPSLVIMSVMDKWTAAYTRISSRTALTGKLMLITTGLFLGLGLTLRMDMLMCMFITLSLYTFYKMYSGRGSGRDRWLFPIYVFLGIFTKGPVAILVPLLSVIVFLLIESRFRTFGRYWGWRTWGVLLLLCALWFGCVYAEGGSAYLDNLLFNQTVNRAVDSFHHKAPFYYYLISFWYSVAPWSLLIFGCFISKLSRNYHTDSIERFYIVVSLTTTVMLLLISSKIAIYLAPAFPFFVYAAVISLNKSRWSGWSALALAVPAAVFTLLIVALVVADIKSDMVSGSYYYAVAALSLSGLAALFMLYGRRDIHGAVNVMAAGLLLTVFIGGMEIPSFNGMIGFGNVCSKVKEVAAQEGTDKYATFGIRRPESMDVFLGRDVDKIDEASDIVGGKYNGYVIIIPERKVTEELDKFLSDHKKTTVDNYIIVTLK